MPRCPRNLSLVSLVAWQVLVIVSIEYRTQKDLPCDQLYRLFLAVSWAAEDTTTQDMMDYFNIGFLHSTFVFSAWADGRLVGCVRALSGLHGIIMCESGVRHIHLLSASNDIAAYPYVVAESLP